MGLIPKPETLPPLIIGVKTGLYRKDDKAGGNADKEFRDIKPEILQRDHNTCGYCGVQTQGDEKSPGGGLEVHHIDDNHRDNRGQNLISICPLCHAIFHFGHAARVYKTLKIGYLPWISQENLNILTWTLAIASHRRKVIGAKTDLSEEERAAVEISTKADELFWAIKTEAILPAKHFTSEDTDGSEITRLLTDDPSALATALAGIAIEQPHLYQQRAKVIGNLRVIFQPDRIGELIPRFSDMPLWFPGKSWASTWKAIANAS